MPVTTTVGALAVAAALAAGPALTTTPALVADQTDNRTCTVQTTTGDTTSTTTTGSKDSDTPAIRQPITLGAHGTKTFDFEDKKWTTDNVAVTVE